MINDENLNPDDLLRHIDSTYEPFPSFEEWSTLTIDLKRWSEYLGILEKYKDDPTVNLQRARDIVQRTAAIETGVIEGLYEGVKGFTFTAALGSSMWEHALSQREERVQSLIKSQMAAYDYVLDFAREDSPIVEAWIRELHRELCKAQDTYDVLTSDGPQYQELKKGQYKSTPNHVKTRLGTYHAYAPVDMVSPEMQRLCEEVATNKFKNAHPVLQSAYIHYAFVAIHPFSDGNGRVSRALASIFMYRSLSVPLLITDENKLEYFISLEYADNNRYQEFVDFIFNRAIDSIKLIVESLNSSRHLPPEELFQSLSNMYTSDRIRTSQNIDLAACNLLESFSKQIHNYAYTINDQKTIQITVSRSQAGHKGLPARYRIPAKPSLSDKNEIAIRASTIKYPVEEAIYYYGVFTPKNIHIDKDILIVGYHNNDTIRVSLEEISPSIKPSCSMRLEMIVHRIISSLIAELQHKVQQKFDDIGY